MRDPSRAPQAVIAGQATLCHRPVPEHPMRSALVLTCALGAVVGACAGPPRSYTVRTAAPPHLQQVVDELRRMGYVEPKQVDGAIYATARSSSFLDALPRVRTPPGSFEPARAETERKVLVVRPAGARLVLRIERTTCIQDGSSFTGACAAAGDATDDRSRHELVHTGRWLERRLGR
jgi:hypothetical protein